MFYNIVIEKMDWQPTYDRVLVKPQNAEQMIGGLYIPDVSTNMKKGLVIAVGPGKQNDMSIKPGQTALYKTEDGTPITLDEEHYLILREQDIWVKK